MPGLPLAAGEEIDRGPAASPYIHTRPHPVLAAVGSQACWDLSTYQAFSVCNIFMDVGDPRFSVGEASRQLLTLVFCHLGTFSVFGLPSWLPQHF